MSHRNLGLNIDVVGADNPQKVARVALVHVNSYTRDGGAPILSADCTDPRNLAAEVERLQGELADALAEMRREWTGKVSEEPSRVAETATTPGKVHPRLAGLVVRDVMTPNPKTVHRNDNVATAGELMNTGRFRHVIVVDEDDNVAGVVSRRDIFYGALAWSLGYGKSSYDAVLSSSPVKAVMQRHVRSVPPEAPLAEAAGIMLDFQLGCLPVVEGNSLVGIITQSDFLALFVDQKSG